MHFLVIAVERIECYTKKNSPAGRHAVSIGLKMAKTDNERDKLVHANETVPGSIDGHL